MYTISTKISSNSIFFSVVLKKLLNSKSIKIIMNTGNNTNKNVLKIQNYNYEVLLNEFEMRYGKIDFVYGNNIFWDRIEVLISDNLSKINKNNFSKIISFFEKIIIQKKIKLIDMLNFNMLLSPFTSQTISHISRKFKRLPLFPTKISSFPTPSVSNINYSFS